MTPSEVHRTLPEPKLSTDGGSVPPPANWSGGWRHIPVHRKRDNPPRARQPLHKLPENLPSSATGDERETSRSYWSGEGATWGALTDAVGKGFDVALLVGASGLVVVDCDVKDYDADTGYVMVDPSRAVMTGAVTKRGVDDLRSVVEGLGHRMAELRTYMVSTPSGGLHLVFRENPSYPVNTTGHRDNWRIDVVARNRASNRSWVAAPPTPGYRVVGDLPLLTLPDWLAEWLQHVTTHLPPVGGRTVQRLDELSARLTLEAGTGAVDLEDDTGSGTMLERLVQLRLNRVTAANRYGGWNLAIFQVVKDLLSLDLDPQRVGAAVLRTAEPENDLEVRRAKDTINSAYRSWQRESLGGTATTNGGVIVA